MQGRLLEDWCIDYNTERPHSSLDNLTPEEFIQQENEKIAAATNTLITSSTTLNSNTQWYNKWGKVTVIL